MAVEFIEKNEDLWAHVDQYKEWGLMPWIPESTLRAIDKFHVEWLTITDSIDIEIDNWDTHREFSETEVLERTEEYIVLRNKRCTVSTNERTVTHTYIHSLPKRKRIYTNMWMGDGKIRVYVEASGVFPDGDIDSQDPEVLKIIAEAPKKIWDQFGRPLPDKTKLWARICDWRNAFKAGEEQA